MLYSVLYASLAVLVSAVVYLLLSPPSLTDQLFEAAFNSDLHRLNQVIHSLQQEQPQQQISLLRDSFNNTALHWAVKSPKDNSLQCVDALLSVDCSLFAVNGVGSGISHWAVVGNNRDLLVGLLDRVGSDSDRIKWLSQLNARSESSLHWSVDWLSVDLIPILMKYLNSTHLNAVDSEGDTPLHRIPMDCVDRPRCLELVDLLIDYGANVTAENRYHRKPLQHLVVDPLNEQQRAAIETQLQQFRHNLTEEFQTV